MHAKPDLRVFLKWMVYRSGSVITDVIHLSLAQKKSPERFGSSKGDCKRSQELTLVGKSCSIPPVLLIQYKREPLSRNESLRSDPCLLLMDATALFPFVPQTERRWVLWFSAHPRFLFRSDQKCFQNKLLSKRLRLILRLSPDIAKLIAFFESHKWV